MQNPASTRVPARAVLLDAYGTLLDREDPVPALTALLAEAGHDHPPERVAEALRSEVAHYRIHLDRGRDAPSLAALRRECAQVLADGLGGDAPVPGRLAEILLESLRFRLFADAIPALDALAGAGLRLAVVSNWDCTLAATLRELGVADRFEVVSASALVGARKPDPAIFAHTLGLLGIPPSAALHCGDVPGADCLGAHRAGVRAVLIDRRGDTPPSRCPRVTHLTDLVEWIGR